MIEETVFKSNKEIKNFISSYYGIKINNIKKINRGSANIYMLDDKYVLKEFQSKYDKEQVDLEVTVINHLKSKKIKVPKYIKTVNNEYSVLYKQKTIIIQKKIDGYTLDNNEGNYNQTIECARIYGKLVNALKDLPISLNSGNIEDWYSKEKFEKGIKEHQELLSLLSNNDDIDVRIREDLMKKIEIIKNVKKIDYSEMKNLTIMNTHGDYNVSQFIYKNDKINAIIDFVSACKMPVAWELIRSYSYIDKDAKDGTFNLDTFTKYIKEFNKYVKLNKYDIRNICNIYLVQILNSTFGYKQYVKNHNSKDLLEFAFFRTKLCIYLYNYSNLIQKRLEEELW